MCHDAGKNWGMNKKTTYLIPAGTLIKTRNMQKHLRMSSHITRQELCFDDIANTGDGGLLWYFQHEDWLIAVEAHRVLHESPLVQAPAA